MLSNLTMPPADALHGVMDRFRNDPRPTKIDLGVGVYRDSQGKSPVMEAVQQAELAVVQQQTSKAYLGLRGVDEFLHGMYDLVFGDRMQDRVASIQTVGGTGAVRLAIELAARANPELRVHVGVPTWPNHLTICEMLNVEAVTYPYFEQSTQSLLFDQSAEAIRQAAVGDVVVLHGPCHNPSGADLSDEQFLELLALASARGAVPLIDMAYYGLGNDIDQDLQRVVKALEDFPTAFLVMSCSKAFGLYRERLGILFVISENSATRELADATLQRMARGNYSMPPSHAAFAVARVLNDDQLRQLWRAELEQMRARIEQVRATLFELGDGHPVVASIPSQKGIFSLLPIERATVDRLANDHAIYMPDSGRINIAGLKTGDEAILLEAITQTPV